MKRQIISQLKTVLLGDLCLVEWHDASICKSLRGGGADSIDVPVCSFGIFIGLLGEHRKHIVLAQNNFRYASGLYDIDYTAIPVPWACKIAVLVKGQVEAEMAGQLLQSFLISSGRARIAKSCGRQQRLHGYG